jgi:hypothetical protein
LRRQLEAQAPPEPESAPEPAVDPEAEQAILRSAHGALSFKNAEQQAAAQAAAPKPVDPEIQRAGLASSYGALAQNAPPPPVTRKPSPVPVGLQDRVQPQEFNLAPPEPQSQAEYDSEHPKASIGGLPQQGDDAPPEVNQWAIAADLMFNGGRGVQQIVGLAHQQRQAWEQRRGKNLSPLEQARLEIERGNLEARKAELEHRNAVLQGKFGAPGKTGPGAPPSPDDAVKPEPFNQDEVVTANLGDPPDPSEIGDRIPDFVDPGKGGSNAGETPAQKLARERFEYQKARDAKKDGEKSGKGDAGGKLDLIPGTEATDESGYKSYIGASAANRDKLTAIVAAHNEMRDGYAELEKLRTELGPTWSDPENSAKFANIRGSIIGGAGKLRDLGVLQNAEYERLATELPSSEVSATEVKDRAKALVTWGQSWKTDPVVARIRGMREAFESESDSKLKPYGIRLKRGDGSGGVGQGGGDGASPAKSASEPPSVSPDVGGGEDDSARYDVQLTSPKGKTITGSLSKAEVEGYVSKGWKVRGEDDGFEIKPLKVGKQSKLAPSEPGELGPPVGLDVETVKGSEDPLDKWHKKGRVSGKRLTDDDLFDKYPGIMVR